MFVDPPSLLVTHTETHTRWEQLQLIHTGLRTNQAMMLLGKSMAGATQPSVVPPSTDLTAMYTTAVRLTTGVGRVARACSPHSSVGPTETDVGRYRVWLGPTGEPVAQPARRSQAVPMVPWAWRRTARRTPRAPRRMVWPGGHPASAPCGWRGGVEGRRWARACEESVRRVLCESCGGLCRGRAIPHEVCARRCRCTVCGTDACLATVADP